MPFVLRFTLAEDLSVNSMMVIKCASDGVLPRQRKEAELVLNAVCIRVAEDGPLQVKSDSVVADGFNVVSLERLLIS